MGYLNHPEAQGGTQHLFLVLAALASWIRDQFPVLMPTALTAVMGAPMNQMGAHALPAWLRWLVRQVILMTRRRLTWQ